MDHSINNDESWGVACRVLCIQRVGDRSDVAGFVGRVLGDGLARHEWQRACVGAAPERGRPEAPIGAASNERMRRQELVWDVGSRPFSKRVAALRDLIRETRADVVLPGDVPEALAAAGLESARGVRVVGVCMQNSDESAAAIEACGGLMHGVWVSVQDAGAILGRIKTFLRAEAQTLASPYALGQSPAIDNADPQQSNGDLEYDRCARSLETLIQRVFTATVTPTPQYAARVWEAVRGALLRGVHRTGESVSAAQLRRWRDAFVNDLGLPPASVSCPGALGLGGRAGPPTLDAHRIGPASGSKLKRAG